MSRHRNAILGFLAFVGLTTVAIAVVGAATASNKAAVDPPYIVVLGGAATAYLPDGSRVILPAGAEIDACVPPGGGFAIIYETASRTVHIPSPCAERPIFNDGFED